MTTSTFQINAGNLDGGEENDTTWYHDGFDSDGIRYGFHTNIAKVGLIFPSVTVPAGATVSAAYIEAWAGYQAGLGDALVTYKGIAEDNCAVWLSDGTNSPSTRSYEATTVNGTIVEANITDEAWYQFDDITSVVQAVIDRAGWASGNRLGIVITSRSGGTDAARMQFHDWFNNNAHGAKLTVTYTVPAKGLILLMSGDGGFL